VRLPGVAGKRRKERPKAVRDGERRPMVMGSGARKKAGPGIARPGLRRGKGKMRGGERAFWRTPSPGRGSRRRKRSGRTRGKSRKRWAKGWVEERAAACARQLPSRGFASAFPCCRALPTQVVSGGGAQCSPRCRNLPRAERQPACASQLASANLRQQTHANSIRLDGI